MNLDAIELFSHFGNYRIGLNFVKKISSYNLKALESKNWNFVWANEYDYSDNKQIPYNIYCKRFNSDIIVNEDLKKIDISSIPSHTLLCGSFPMSNSTYYESLLFKKVFEILLYKETPFLFLEASSELLKKNKKKLFSLILKNFNELGYNVNWCSLNACELGFAENSKRLYIFAYKDSLNYSKKFLKSSDFNNIFKKSIFYKSFKINYNSYNVNPLYYSDFGFLIDGVVYTSDIIYPLKNNKHILDFVIKRAEFYDSLNDLKNASYFMKTHYSEPIKKNDSVFSKPSNKLSFSDNIIKNIVYDYRINDSRVLTPVESEIVKTLPPNWTKGIDIENRYYVLEKSSVIGVITKIEPFLKNIIKLA